MGFGADNQVVMSLGGVGYRYGKDLGLVVDGVGCELVGGKMTALIGPNAAGKSTLVKMMLGQLVPSVGEVLLGGEVVGEMGHIERARRIAYVPQRGGECFGYRVEQVVGMSRAMIGDVDGAVEWAIEHCDLGGLRDRVFGELSVGQQQRVLLARGVAQCWGGGKVLLLDEPCSGMDLKHIYEAMELLKGFLEGGLAVLIVLHDLNLVSRYADDVWLMNEGRMVKSGSWDEVLRGEVLEDVYGVNIRMIEGGADGRPMIYPEPAGTMVGGGVTKL